ncbi:MAG: hypothetical protein NTY19_16790 [Planctomycetota bacterium]|nr:hypothetical protein [Planctomycetota bacterium]
MTAAEFGPKSTLSSEQAAMVRVVVAEATSRAEKVDPRRAVAVARLRKYGLAAGLLSVASATALCTFHEQIAEPAQQVLTPWRITASDVKQQAARESSEPEELGPIVVRISGSTPALRPDGTLRIPRGGAVELEVSLSRPADRTVEFCYRVAGAGEQTHFQRLEMVKIERLNSFGAKLTDVDSDVEFFAATGIFESQRHQIQIYDPIVVSGFEVGVKYPDYLQLPDRTEVQASGDVTAPSSAAATVSVLTNRPLKAGSIRWDDGQEEQLSIDPAKETAALVRFPVATDRNYTFTLEDVDGQHYTSPSPSLVHALQDEPPTVALNSPSPNLLVHPQGGVTFSIEASDDFGLDTVELVYMPQTDDSSREIRVPLVLPKAGDGPFVGRVPVTCLLRLAMEELNPRLQPGGTISYYVEARDRNPKHGRAATDLGFLYIRPYETWATLSLPEPPEETHPVDKILDQLVRAVWNLHRQQDRLPAEEFRKQAHEWAKWMEDDSGAVLKLVILPHGLAMTPVKRGHLDKGNEYCVQAHGALGQADTLQATRFLRLATGEQALVGFQDEMLAQLGQSPNAPDANGQPDATLAANQLLKRMEVDVLSKLDAPDKKAAKNDAAAAEAASQETAQIKQAQEDVIKKAETAEGGPQAAPKPSHDTSPGEASAKPQPQPASAAEQKPDTAGPAPNKATGLAADETALANKTKAAADKLRQESVAPQLGQVAGKLDDAARKMTKAADEFKSGKVEQGITTSKEARIELAEAETQLGTAQQSGIDNALADLQAQAQRVLQHQQELRGKVQDTGQKLTDGEKPNTQQERDLKTAVVGQVRVKAELERLAEGLTQLDKTAPASAGRETAKFIAEANRDMKRGRPDQKMSNAVVELTLSKPAAAAKEQQAAETALEKVLARLTAAEGTLASDWKSEARRAQREAEALAKVVASLSGKEQPLAQANDAQGDEAKGEQAKTPDRAAFPQADPHSQPLSQTERGELAEQAAIDATRLARHVQTRDLAEKSDRDALAQAAANPTQLAGDLLKSEQARDDLANVARRISNKIEAEMQAKINAEKLLSAQREQCPPQYRELVNKYYEALSNVKK